MRYLKSVYNRIGVYPLKAGIYHHNRAEHKQAIEFLRRALGEPELGEFGRRTATHFLALSYIGWADEHQGAGQRDHAIEKLGQALELAPGYADLHVRKGRLLREAGRAADALAAFRRALEINPDFAEARFELGLCRLDRDETRVALEDLERAFRVRMREYEEPFARGKELIERGEVEKGRELVRRAFARRPALAETEFRAGLRSLQRERYAEAIEHLGRAAQLEVPRADVQNLLGVACAESGKLEEAEEHFLASLEIHPGFRTARLNLAFLLCEMGQGQRGGEELRRVLKEEPDNHPALDRIHEIEGAARQGGRQG